MASVQRTGSLTGSISSQRTISGGTLSASAQKAGDYTGEYSVTPLAYEEQVLQTANKTLTQNITIAAVPYSEVSNLSDGKTVYIASEV